MFDHLYKTGSNCDGGTLLQLWNLVNRRNIAKDVTRRFNETTDFVELVINCHIVAAGMKFFGLKSVSGEPTYNPSIMKAKNEPKERQWKQIKVLVGQLVDRYVQPSQEHLFLENYQLSIGMFLKICMLYAFNLSIVTVWSMQQGLQVNTVMYKLPHLHLSRNVNFLAGYRVQMTILM